MHTQVKKPFLYKEKSYIVQGCFFDIRNQYGPGHKESIYQNLIIEYLKDRQIKIEKEKLLCRSVFLFV